ncbi:MAG: NlpC/P60 family protein [Rickettsiales bacterium]|nr:NlpC/P60 family protein [Pseudomonadota bacterium]MDA0966646.1 NlpC/P60 family protein [Pseudomonadota bacterium]MDG4543674.1 NlpC/P60 family protein [Rickettsiales bacterium]MDG4545821.1 NlpC/P60 family protein [Rickettsiales bacterium]MDG4547405.1 NlpC/P60 family protein [Rickettsiales bacterium]
MVNRNDIVVEARSWIGTRFHHQGRVKKSSNDKGGVDCIGLILGVAEAVGITHNGISYYNYDKREYAKVPDNDRLKLSFQKYLKEIDTADVKSGDILMFKFDKEPQHVGFVVKEKKYINLIHCYMQARGVVEHRLDEYWKNRIVTAFAFLD